VDPSYRYRLLFVGVNAVPDGPPLQAAARDAQAVSTRFAAWGLNDPERHRLFLNQDAIPDRIHDELGRAVCDDATDLLLIYWAGHMSAGRRHRLATTETGTAISSPVTLDTLTSALLAAPARHRMLVLDATNAGTGALHLRRLARAVPPEACASVLASTASSTRSREHPRRGYLTGALLEQLAIASRSLSPTGDLLDVLRMTASTMTTRLNQPPVVGIYGAAAPLRLPSLRPDASARQVRAA
jgi:hypothetical protein